MKQHYDHIGEKRGECALCLRLFSNGTWTDASYQKLVSDGYKPTRAPVTTDGPPRLPANVHMSGRRCVCVSVTFVFSFFLGGGVGFG